VDNYVENLRHVSYLYKFVTNCRFISLESTDGKQKAVKYININVDNLIFKEGFIIT